MKNQETDALLDEKVERDEENGGDAEQEQGNKQDEEKVIEDPMAQLRELCRGTMKLMAPFRAHGEDVKEVTYDFCGLTSAEMMDALDSVPVNNMFTISNKQALALFAVTAEKNAPMVDDGGRKTRLFDKRDVMRMGAADSVKAVQIAKLFYLASGQAGNNNISKQS